MARKINPFIFRAILNRNWNCIWYIKKNFYSNYLIEDLNIRNYLEKIFKKKPIGKIIIIKNSNFIYFLIYLKKGSLVNKNMILSLKKNIFFFTDKNVYFKFKSISNHNIDVKIILFYIKRGIEFNKSYKGIIKNIISNAFKSRCLGLKIAIQGRINGNIMTRKQIFFHGKLPLQKFCANIKYSSGTAQTVHGCIGIKVWLYLGDFIY
ncbi:SSU ribosomal protein S3p (S3e) [Candidatus Nasuia deltocephalinicola]|uniref:30S ribosomal protein S3 n=1 Tax=Candidatus Nasuia deltocephalincola TaxID=1160784 RepID=A0A0S2UPL1_9PROT|nr:SSU ribosomal protein S3p (S3e) [Candidatus Nasuia deltocephalinicola]